jgi:hypothetical protein
VVLIGLLVFGEDGFEAVGDELAGEIDQVEAGGAGAGIGLQQLHDDLHQLLVLIGEADAGMVGGGAPEGGTEVHDGAVSGDGTVHVNLVEEDVPGFASRPADFP